MTLRQTLRNMLNQAQHSGSPARVRLAKGLTVSLRVDGNLVDVQLSRATVYPSIQEWKTVMQQWPGQCVVVKEPKAIVGTGMYYLMGGVRMTPELAASLPVREKDSGE